MEPALFILLFLAAFIVSRLFRSTKMWWILVFTIMAGLLVGILSSSIVTSQKENGTTSIAQLVNTVNEDESLVCMQSLVVTVTEGTTICQTGVVGYNSKLYNSFDALANSTYTNGRDSPYIEDDS